MTKEEALAALRDYEPESAPDRSSLDWYDRRAAAVSAAKDAGATYLEISDILFLSPGRVSKLDKRAKGICHACGQSIRNKG